jgi:predicted nucleic acid-binding protein
MEGFVTDTMAIILWLEMRRMPARIKTIFKRIEANEALLYVPGMVLIELGYLSEKNRIDISLQETITYCRSNKNIIQHPADIKIIEKTFEIKDIPELHDRIIAASGRLLNYPVITNDPNIIASKFVTTVWN